MCDVWCLDALQYYAMDTLAAAASTTAAPFNFSVDPSAAPVDFAHYAGSGGGNVSARLADASNFVSYAKVGNVGYATFSGAHEWAAQADALGAACAWARDEADAGALAVLLLIGHWSEADDGCRVQSTPRAYETLRDGVPACRALGSRLRFVMGHTHCNAVEAEGAGFMVGANGMAGCGEFGLTALDTTGNRTVVYHFPIADHAGLDLFAATHACLGTAGLTGCAHLAHIWMNESTAEL